jgi:hypothetical protein
MVNIHARQRNGSRGQFLLRNLEKSFDDENGCFVRGAGDAHRREHALPPNRKPQRAVCAPTPSREEALVWAARLAKACRCTQEVRESMFDPES